MTRSSVFSIGALCCCAVAVAQGLRPDVLANYGGRYALDCAKHDSPRVVVLERQMRVEQCKQVLNVGNLDSAFSYFSNTPPPEFRVALMGRVQGRHEVIAIVNGDGRGQFLTFDGDPTVKAALRADLASARFRHCMPHDCGDNNAVLLYDAAQGRVYGLLHQRGKTQGFGAPPGPLLIDLNQIWRREWRQGR